MLKKVTTSLIFIILLSLAVIGYAQTGVCTGTVTDEEGLPIEGAWVTLHPYWGWGWGNSYSTETLEDGTFIIEDVEVGEYHASAFSWEHGWDSEEIEIFEGQTTVVDFVLESWGGGGDPTGVCSGTVTDEEGLPLEGACVTLQSTSGWGWGWGNSYSTETLEDGTFIIEDVEVGEYHATASLWGYGWDSEEIEIIEDDTTVVDFVLEIWGGGGGPTGTCSGTVTDEEGLPIEGAWVTLQSSGWGWGNTYSTETLEDGSFIIEDVEVGEYTASAFAWGYGWDSEEIEIFEDQTTVVDFVLESWGGGPTGACSGTVTDSAGLPVEGASVTLHSSGWGWGWGWGSNWYNTQTLEDGTFIIEDVEVGEYHATAFSWGLGWDSEEIEIIEDQTTIVDFVLEGWGWGGGGPTGICSGTVSDSVGLPVEGAWVTLHSCGGWGWGSWYSTETLEDGSFIIEDVEVGEYTATAFSWGLGWDFEEIEILEGQTTVVDFLLVGWGWGGGGGGFETVELTGTAMVVEHGRMNFHYLDVDGDERADYKLNFGPSWYDPQSGATRPENGDNIEIVGGLLEFGNPPMVVVYEINDLFWRDPIGTDPGELRRLRDRLRPDQGDQLVSFSSHPNPFNPETTISYELNDDAKVKIAVYNTLGQRVASLVDQNQPAGAYQFKWNAGNHASGFYFIKLDVDGRIFTQRLILTK